MNLLKTIFGFLAGLGILALVVQLFGCTALPNGSYDCSVSTWIPPQYQGAIALGLMILGGLIKMFGSGGTVTENLVNKTVVVTDEVKPGTVTPEQVKAG